MLELKLNTAQAAGRSLKEHTDFRQKLNELTHNQSMLEQRLDSLKMSNSSNAHLWTIQHTVDKLKKNQDTIEKKYETRSQTGEDDENELNQVIDQQQIEQLIHKSTDIKNLYANITNIHNLLAATPASLTQADIDAAIASSEQRIIEKMAHINNTKPAIKPSEPKNEDPKTSDQAVNDRITRLEKRLDDLSKSISSFVTRPTIDDLIRDAIANSKPTTSQTVISPQPDISLQNRIALIEERLGTFSLVKDLDEIKLRLKKIENSANDHIHHVPLVEHAPSPSVAQSIPTHRPNVDDPRMTSLEKQVNDHTSFLYELREQINVLERTKIVHSEASQLVNASEERIKQAMNNLPKCVHRECQDARLPDVINRINSHSTVIQTLSQQINVLDGNKPDLKIVEKLIKDNVKQGKGTKAVSADGNERYDPRISGLQEQLNTHLELIHSLEKQLEQLVQQFISKCERPASDLSDILQKIHNHTIAIQDLNDRMNQLPNIQSNDELRRKVDDIDREVKRAHKELADLRRKLAQQSTSTSQPSPPLPPGKDSSAKQHTDEDYQAIMPFIEVLPTYNLFADNEWD
jgi:tetrahydromethanopterin S-methyltransferase subunit B